MLVLRPARTKANGVSACLTNKTCGTHLGDVNFFCRNDGYIDDRDNLDSLGHRFFDSGFLGHCDLRSCFRFRHFDNGLNDLWLDNLFDNFRS